ncbi:hypothetical protein OH77DRAFT_1431108 [Trametes cingulata]|nr:hypothetical protein OH77DRAFT_1431108 [Trametes cingulata]
MTYNILVALDLDLSPTEGLRPSVAYHRNMVMPQSSESPSPDAGPVYDVPMAYNEHCTRTRGLELDNVTERRKRDINNSREWTVGPMPVEQFLDDFLPSVPPEKRRDVLSSRAAFKDVPSSGDTPAAIFKPLIAALNKSTKHKSRAPGFVFVNASARSENPHKPGYMKPHICCYASRNVERVLQSPITSRSDIGYAELFIEVKSDGFMDFFVDPPSTATEDELSSHEFVAEHHNEEVRARVNRALGQHISYATEILARQQRVFLFSISMAGSSARIFRWDRSGLIVTRSFDIREQPELMCDFFSRFAFATDAHRGHDETVEMATAEEEVLFRDKVTQYVREQLEVVDDELATAVSVHYLPGHVMAANVFAANPEGPGITPERYLVSRPVTSPLYLNGRATRGYWAVHASTGQLVFLKDTWRLPQESEGAILARLNTAGVRYVPSLVTHGDVYWFSGREVERLRTQTSRTDRYDRKPWVCRVRGEKVSVSTHIHYRMVLGTVGYNLKTFKGTDELLRATYDVFHAMRDALQKDSRIHRDISIGNIILVRETAGAARRGYLIDWETSSLIDEKGQSLDPERTGTWRFMSYKVLADPEKPHIFQDDMESLFYVVLYCSLHHLSHSLTPGELGTFLHEFFDQSAFCFGALRGGTGKGANAGDRFWTRRVSFRNADLQTWLDTVMDYNGPPRARRAELKDHWTNPDYLDTFWGAFLQASSLPCNDRVHNAFIKPHRFRDHTEPSLIPLRKHIFQAEIQKRLAASAGPPKRPRPANDIAPLRRSKRLRSKAADMPEGKRSSAQG